MNPRLSAFSFRPKSIVFGAWEAHSMYYNYLPTKIGSGYGLTMAGFSCHCARRISVEIYCNRDLGGLANLACTLSQLYEPRPAAFPHFCLPRTHVTAKATTASHNSYKVRPVGSPLISTFTMHLRSATNGKQATRTRRWKISPEVYVIGSWTCTLWSGRWPKSCLFLSTCMSERILLQESKGGLAKELQRTSGLYDAIIRFSLLSPPVAVWSAFFQSSELDVGKS